MNLDDFLRDTREWVDRGLDRWLPPADKEPRRLHEAMRYAVFAGGKRLRPAVARAACRAAGGTDDDTLPSACALEMLQQAGELGVGIDRVVHATGSSGTQAGLVAGFDGMQSGVRVLGITVGRPRDNQEKNVARLVDETWARLGMKGPPPRGNIEANDAYFGESYGVPTDAMKDAIRLVAETESILLDPTRARAHGVTLTDLIAAIDARNVTGTGGLLERSDERKQVVLSSRYHDPFEVGETVVAV